MPEKNVLSNGCNLSAECITDPLIHTSMWVEVMSKISNLSSNICLNQTLIYTLSLMSKASVTMVSKL